MVTFTAFWSRLGAATVGILFSLFCFHHQNKIFAFIYWTGISLVASVEMMSIMKIDKIMVQVANSIMHLFIHLHFYQGGKFDTDFMSFLFLGHLVLLFLEGRIEDVGVLFFSVFWITIPCHLCYYYTQRDPNFMVKFLCVVWFMDAGAYFSGHLFGRTPLLQSVSPKKTWEGSIGGSLVTLLVAYLCSYPNPTGQNLHFWMNLALISIFFGQLGDLFESLFKRIYGVKDSGSFLLGHGGILDRFDSVFPSMMIFHLIWYR